MNGLARSLRSYGTHLDRLISCRNIKQHRFAGINDVHVISASSNYFSTLTKARETTHEHGLIKVSPVAQLNVYQRRYKKKRAQRSKKDDEEEEDNDDEDEELANENPLLVDDLLNESGDGSESIVIDINSLRLDAFCKTAFGVTRAKIEDAFYKGDIRINGELPMKKSVEVMKGDEIDMFKHTDPEDSKLIHIKKALVVNLPDKANEAGRVKVDIKRWQNLVIEKPDVKGNE